MNPVGSPVGSSVGRPTASPRVEARVEARAAGVLGAWNRRRAAAWAAGDAESLAALYARGAGAEVADLAMLGRWTDQGLTVRDLTTQLLGIRVVAHGPHRWVLHVRDRVAGGVAAGVGLTEALPRGTEAEREVVLRRHDGSWRVASVRPVRRRPGRR